MAGTSPQPAQASEMSSPVVNASSGNNPSNAQAPGGLPAHAGPEAPKAGQPAQAAGQKTNPSAQIVDPGTPPKLRARHVALAMGVGAIAGAFAILGEMGYIFPLFAFALIDPLIYTLLTVALIAPLVEEAVKPIGLMVVWHEERPDFSLAQWALLGFMAGLGFALMEDALYMWGVSGYGWGTMFMLLGTRLLFPVHMLCTMLTGVGYGLWAKSKNPWHFIFFIAVAMCIHGFFNFAVSVVG